MNKIAGEGSSEKCSSKDTAPTADNKMYSHTSQPRHNTVTTVMLHGIPIVSLYIDGRERLCLAQISNTLLKQYSYNEIHNRRVALGITCVQCTPVQLEILRRAGAMPASSRRCGMISKREAERLVKSFLEENTPPKLPEDFSFDVYHECGWGGRGSFQPSRYNSSRAKCIKCHYCHAYFSPNKFIFHFHRAPSGKYNHPDAANFNSWRRHLKLSNVSEGSDIIYCWEDVKAMFNGGGRKRLLGGGGSKQSQNAVKRSKYQDENSIKRPPYSSECQQQYSMYPPASRNPSLSSFGLVMPAAPASDQILSAGVTATPWSTGQGNFLMSTYDRFWANHLGIARSTDFQHGLYFGKSTSNQNNQESSNNNQSLNISPTSSEEEEDSVMSSSEEELAKKDVMAGKRLSAFKPVTPLANKQRCIEDSFPKKIERSPVGAVSEEEEEHREEEEEEEVEEEEEETCIEVDIVDDTDDKIPPDQNTGKNILKDEKPLDEEPEETVAETAPCEKAVVQEQLSKQGNGGIISGELSPISESKQPVSPLQDLFSMTKEQLHKQLLQEIEARKRIEKECQLINETFQEQVKRDKMHREEMVHQIRIVQETLSNELEQERKARFTLQEKLKEAHDALHSFSCKMLAPRHCGECNFKDALVPR